MNNSYLSVSKPDKKLNIIQVRVKSTDELFAKEFNDKLVANVNEFYIQTKTKKSLQNVSILQTQTDSVKRALNGAIHSTLTVADATPNLNISRQLLREPAQRSQFTADANKVLLTELVKNLELTKMALRRETPLIQIIDAPIIPLEIDKLSKFIALWAGGVIGGGLCIFALILKKIARI